MTAILGVGFALVTSLLTLWLGLTLLVIGFFVIHSMVSGLVPARAQISTVSASQASSIYLCACYVGSAIFGTLSASAWSYAGWPAVVGSSVFLLVVGGLISISIGGTEVGTAPGR